MFVSVSNHFVSLYLYWEIRIRVVLVQKILPLGAAFRRSTSSTRSVGFPSLLPFVPFIYIYTIQLLEAGKDLQPQAVRDLGARYGFGSTANSEIRFRWLSLCLQHNFEVSSRLYVIFAASSSKESPWRFVPRLGLLRCCLSDAYLPRSNEVHSTALSCSCKMRPIR